MPDPILVATIGAPHGIKGEVRVKSFTADPLALGDYKPLRKADGGIMRISRLRPSKSVLIVKFQGVNTREEAEALAKTDLFVDRSVLPDDIEDDEFYVSDLIGCMARDGDGAKIGRVIDVPDFGAGSLVEIALSGTGGTALVEFSHANVPHVDLDNRVITVILPPEVSERDET